MPRLGNTSTNAFRFSRQGTDNVVADLYTMPASGWIRDIAVHAGGYGETTTAKLCVWESDGTLVQASPTQTWGNGRGFKHASMGAIRVDEGDRFYAGFWRDPKRGCAWSIQDGRGSHQVQSYSGHAGPPSRLNPYTAYDGHLTQYVDYVANESPVKGVFTGESPSGTIGSLEPTFSGTLDHPPEDRELDYSTQIHIRIYDKTTRKIVLDREYSTTASERTSESFARQFYVHEAGHLYYAEYRHRDTWGVYSRFSEQIHYAVGNGPAKPAVISPAANEKYQNTAPIYTVAYDHPQNKTNVSLQARLYDGAGTRLLATSDLIGAAANPKANISKTHAQMFPTTSLSLGTQYQVQFRFRDSSGVYGDWSNPVKFRVNAYPYVPSMLTPSGGRATGSAVLRCSVSDPDGDPVTALAYLYNSSGTLLSGFPKAMTIAEDGTTATLDVAGSLTLGSSYTWRASASDGLLTSSLSAASGFVYASVPMVTITAPAQQGGVGIQTNAALQPSAEYTDVSSGYWTLGAGIQTTQDEDAASGIGAWESGVTAGGSSAMTSPLFDLQASRPFRLFAAFKGYIGNARSYLALECFNSSGASLGFVVAHDAAPDGFWSRKGKTIAPSEYPAGTTRARVVCRPAHLPTEAEAVVRSDAFEWGSLDAGATAQVDVWRGYFDGDTVGYGPPKTDANGLPVGDYSWTGEPGNSASRGLSILTTPSNVEVHFTYASSSGRAKADDRLVVERWSGTAWVERFRSDFGRGAGARTAIPVAPGTFDSGSRYRLKLNVRDSLGLEFESEWIEFDVRYQGPPEVVVSQVAPDANRAEITVSFSPTTLSPLEFAGLEIEVEGSSGERVSHLLTDPAATSFTYRFPESGYRHRFRLRQTRLVSDERVEGEWTEVEGSVDFFPVFFIKSVDDPDLQIAFFVPSSSRPSHKPVRNKRRYETWGSTKAKFAVGKLRTTEGTLTVTLFDDPAMRFTNVIEADEKLRILEKLEENEDVVCILSHKPTRKRFCFVTDWGSHTTNDAEDYQTEIAWEEVDYREDYRLEHQNP